MKEETAEQQQPLRSGFTTGACATATSLAAARWLLADAPADHDKIHDRDHETTTVCTITLPKGDMIEFSVELTHKTADTAEASTVKDAGDDPDITHGASVFARVTLCPEPGVQFRAARGVGTVTRSGLAIAVGEAAINPVPRRMMEQHLMDLARAHDYTGGFDVAIGVENGEQLAARTMNPRLGIVNGLSILGTSGIVRPFSCSAYIASIQQAIDVCQHNGITHIAACTGASSEKLARATLTLDDMALIEMGDFVGAVLKHLRKVPIARLSIVAGFGKMTKLAGGAMDLHSRASSIDFAFLRQQCETLGGDAELGEAVEQANTSIAALKLCQQQNLPLGDAICALARDYACQQLPAKVWVECRAIDRQGQPVGCADFTAGQRQ